MLVALPASSEAQRRGGGFNRYFGSPDEFYQPPDFHGNNPYDGRFTFARVKYRGYEHFSGREGPGWSHDYPDGESNFTRILRDITAVRPFVENGPMVGSVLVSLEDPLIFRYPVSYMSEPGGWRPNAKEIAGLRAYMLKGGFMIFDDFREGGGMGEFTWLQQIVSQAIPGAKFQQMSGKEAIFDSFFKIDLKLTVNSTSSYGRSLPTYWALYQDNDPKKRLMMIANVDNDIGESWQYSASGFVPIASSNEIYKLGVNYIIYALTH
jgi:hypothetical protein